MEKGFDNIEGENSEEAPKEEFFNNHKALLEEEDRVEELVKETASWDLVNKGIHQKRLEKIREAREQLEFQGNTEGAKEYLRERIESSLLDLADINNKNHIVGSESGLLNSIKNTLRHYEELMGDKYDPNSLCLMIPEFQEKKDENIE
ncbi:MAG: hypothetical protein KAI84_15205 [Gammaproteobacteria bacterium]|nr:hypothetical protein [Gammaproteobacteria bacterium]